MTSPPASTRTALVPVRSHAWLAAGIPLAVLGAVAYLALPISKVAVLSASDSQRVDTDGDGLTDFQESVFGTDPDAFDSDSDGFSDLEEIARGSDPFVQSLVPTSPEVNLGMYASVQNGTVSLDSAVFVPMGDLLDLGFYFGAVVNGETFFVPGEAVAASSRKFVYPAANGAGYLAVIELALPEWMVHHVGQVGFFAGAATGDPYNPDTPRKVAAMTLVSVANTIMSVNPAGTTSDGDGDGDGGGGGQASDGSGGGGDVGGGVFYEPLAGDDEIPAELSSGEVCVQSVSLVGTNGASDLYEVDSAGCEPMDSYCAGSSCSATIGQPLEVTNPHRVFGGE